MTQINWPKTSIVVVFLLFSTVLTAEKADHLKGQSNLNPGNCAAQTCLIPGPSNGWYAFQRLTNPKDTIQFQVETNQNLLGSAGSDYWARISRPTTNTRICLSHYLNIPQEAKFQVSFDYFIPSTEYQSSQNIAIYLARARTNSSDQDLRDEQVTLQEIGSLSSATKKTHTSPLITFKKTQFAFLFICDNYDNNKAARITNIHVKETCDLNEFVITLIDRTEKCGKKDSFSAYANADFFRYLSSVSPYFQFDSCNSQGLTPTVVNVGAVQGCAQRNSFNAKKYKATTVKISGSNKVYLIPQTCNLLNGEIICSQSFIPKCRSYAFEGYCLACDQGYSSSIDSKNCLKRVDYCSIYATSGECKTCITDYTLSAGVCLKCRDGFYALDGVCVQNFVSPIPCTSSQYRNSQGVCVEGNVANCGSYVSPSGDCKTCKSGYDLDIFKRCIAPCPTAPNDSQKYLVVNGICVLVDVLCILANDDGYCAVCDDGYYPSKGACYLIPPITQSESNLTVQPYNPYLTDKSGNEYLLLGGGARFYISGPLKDKTIYVDEEGKLYERAYLTEQV